MEKLIIRLEENLIWNSLLKIQRFIMVTAAVITVFIMFLETVLRQFNNNFTGYEEFLLIVVFWMYMMGGSLGSNERSHIVANIIEEYARDGVVKESMKIFTSILTVVLSIILAYWMYKYFLWGIEMNPRTSMWKIPQVIGFSSLFFGTTLMAFYNIVNLCEDIAGFRRKLYASSN
jgi:TRAP-type C4-dicarboxylate transport system permease small subunit